MKNDIIALALVSSFASLAVVGCAARAPGEESTDLSSDKVITWLVSPPSFDDGNLVGTWVPVDPDNFDGGPAFRKTIVFTKDQAGRKYRLGDTAAEADCSAGDGDCAPNGNWVIGNGLLSGIEGVRVNTQSTVVPGNKKSLFVWGMASGEVRLTDLDSCGFLLFECKNTWTRTPMLTEADL